MDPPTCSGDLFVIIVRRHDVVLLRSVLVIILNSAHYVVHSTQVPRVVSIIGNECVVSVGVLSSELYFSCCRAMSLLPKCVLVAPG